MEDCEMCGKSAGDIYIIEIEGAQLRVCSKCAKGEKIIAKETPKQPAPNSATQYIGVKAEEGLELIEGYGATIRNARESMKLPLKVLAEMLNEKETLLLRVEEEKTKPPIELTKKLERALKVRLSFQPKAEGTYHGKKGDSATIGDFIKKS
jgi:putative transcription factor